MVMPFSLQPYGYRVAKMPKAPSRMGSRRNPRASLSPRRSVWWSEQGGTYLPRSIVALDETISSPSVHPFAAPHQRRWGRGWHRRFLRRGLRHGRHGGGTVALDRMRRAASSAGYSGKRIQLGQVPSLEGRQVLCHRMGFGGLARFLPLAGGHISFPSADPSGR